MGFGEPCDDRYRTCRPLASKFLTVPQGIREELIVPSRTSIARVLYATDFSRQSAAALPYALSVARKYGAKFFCVHVVNPGPLPAGFPAHSWHAVVAQAIREARVSMEALEGRWNDVPHEALVCCGDAWTELSKVVREEKIDLIVVGTHGRAGLRKAVLGSVAEKVFRHSSCPVLTVGPKVSGEADRIVELHSILYPTDLSAESRAALPYAVSLAREHGARLYVLHVLQGPSDVDEERVSGEIRRALPSDSDLSYAPKIYIQAGNPGEAIPQLARELAMDLIVLGPKRHSGIPGTMATAYKVVIQAACPVLTVRG
jgi:nucleotide-binding universal stress UspA family protein